MSSLRQQRSNSPRFMPFPGLTGQRGSTLLQQNQGGYIRSPSGSETDSVSTSTENLSHEERYAIRHTPRQEPQGQENVNSNILGSHCAVDGSSSSHSPILSSSCHRVTSIRDFEEPGLVTFHHGKSSSYHQKKSSSPHTSGHCGGIDGGQEKKSGGGGGREITEIPVDYLDQSQVLKHLAKEVTKIKSGRKSLDLSLSSPSSSSNASSSLSSAASSPISLYPPSQKVGGGDIQGESCSAQQCRIASPSMCGGGGGWAKGGRRGSSSEAAIPFRGRLHLSRSQPDLSQLGSTASRVRDAVALKGSATNPRPRAKARDMLEWRLGLATSNPGGSRQTGSGMVEQVVWPQLEMVEILVQENSALKLELEACFQKVAKSQKLEHEVSKVHRSHQELIESCERRERLERAARLRLQGDIRRLQELNHNLSAQLSIMVAGGGSSQVVGNEASSSSNSSLEVSALRKELAERELLLAQLMTSNKELAACKDRQEIELAAQRATLQEQRTHIDILDTALTNAQGNVVRLEEECRKKQMYVERVGQLQRALSSLQLASDRREQTERKLRTQLEREIRELRDRENGNELNKGDGIGAVGSMDLRSDLEKNGEGANMEEEVRELRRQLREREERILAVETELAQWERRCIQEGALRQAAIDAASIPKDAKIAALERTSQESERLVAEARSEKMRHMDEVHAAQRKVADLEARLKDLESRLAERDAMIRVLQKHTYEKDSAVAFLSSTHHTPHTSGLHSSSFHGGGRLHSSTLHGNSLHGNTSLHSNSLHGNSYHGSSLHASSLHGNSYHESSVYRAAEILATTREELGSVSTASVFSTVNSSSGIGGSCDSSSGGNVGNLGGICSPGAGGGVGIVGPASTLRTVQYSSPPLSSGGTASVVGGDAFGGASIGKSGANGGREGASSTTTSNCSFDDAKKSLDDQLKELDSQLLSKRALCCFPGLSNPGSQARKGAVPKPLLAGVAAPSRSLPPHLLFTTASAGDGSGMDEERSRGMVGDKGTNDASARNSEGGRLGARRSGRSHAYGSVLEGMTRYGAMSSTGGAAGVTGNGCGGSTRSGSPSLAGFVPDILKSGGNRYELGGGEGGVGGRRESMERMGEGNGGSPGSTSEEIRLLEKQGKSSQRMRKGDGRGEEEEGAGSDMGKRGGRRAGEAVAQKGGDGGGEGSQSILLVPHLPPRTGIPVPSPRRTKKPEGIIHQGHRRRMVGGGGSTVVGVGLPRGYGRLNEEDVKSGEGLMEGEHGRSSSTSSVNPAKLHHLQPGLVSQPVSVLTPMRVPQSRPSQVVSKMRLFQGSSRSGGDVAKTSHPITGKPSGNTSPLLRERLGGGGKYRIQL